MEEMILRWNPFYNFGQKKENSKKKFLKVQQNLDKLKRQLELQSRSLDTITNMAKEKEEMGADGAESGEKSSARSPHPSELKTKAKSPKYATKYIIEFLSNSINTYFKK